MQPTDPGLWVSNVRTTWKQQPHLWDERLNIGAGAQVYHVFLGAGFMCLLGFCVCQWQQPSH